MRDASSHSTGADAPVHAEVEGLERAREAVAAHLDAVGSSQGAAPIAVVGVGCRVGGLRDAEALFDAIASGGGPAAVVPRRRWDPGEVPEALGAARFGRVLEDLHGFAPADLGISLPEARALDPQQRLLLTVAREALERAGVARVVRGDKAGVYLGLALSDWDRDRLYRRGEGGTAWDATGSLRSVAAGRVAYTLGLTGPALAVDTACSSSLVAVQLAMEALRRGECELAISGGANLLLHPGPSLAFARLGALSPTGACHSFDARADGYVRAEGVGVVVLKRLEAALAAGDPIVAVLHGAAVNQDGRSNGLTAPSGRAQAEVVAAAWRDAGVPLSKARFIEAHGTGTALGDPIEVSALRGALGDAGGPVVLGAAKAVVGHAEAAAGVLGLIVACEVARRGRSAGLGALDVPNPRVRSGSRLQIARDGQALDGPALGGVSAFGLGGTNAHVVVGPPPVRVAPDGEGPVPLLLSASRSEGLRALARALLAAPLPPPRALAASLSLGRTPESWRAAQAVHTVEEARGFLETVAAGWVGQRVSPGLAFGLRLDEAAPEDLDVRLASIGLRAALSVGPGAQGRADALPEGAAPGDAGVEVVLEGQTLGMPASELAAALWCQGVDARWGGAARVALPPTPLAQIGVGEGSSLAGRWWQLLEVPATLRPQTMRLRAESTGLELGVQPEEGLEVAVVEVRSALEALAALERHPGPQAWLLRDAAAWPQVRALARVVRREQPGRLQAALLVQDAPEGEIQRALVGAGGEALRWRGGWQALVLQREAPPEDLSVRGCWWVLGGTGAIGLATAKLLARRGASEVVLVARREPGAQVSAWMQGAAREGVEVGFRQADLGDDAALASLVAEIDGPGGVVLAAGGLHDGLIDGAAADLAGLRIARERVGRALVERAAATGGIALRFAGSAAGLLGNPGQAAYAVATEALAEIAASARAQGVDASCARLGPVDGGVVDADTAAVLRAGGIGLLAPQDAACGLLLGGVDPVVVEVRPVAVAAAPALRAWLAEDPEQRARSADPELAAPPRAANGAVTGKEDEAGPSRDAAPTLDLTIAVLAEVLGRPDGEIEPDRGFFEQGLDSLLGISLTRRLAARLRRELPLTAVFDHPTPRRLADWLRDAPRAELPPAVPRASEVGRAVAIVGVGLRLPGEVRSLDALADALHGSTSWVDAAPSGRWPRADLPAGADRGAFLRDVYRFDAEAFGMSAAEARSTDPRQRMLLELSWEALAHAGLRPEQLRDQLGGVFIGLGVGDYAARLGLDAGDVHRGVGNELSVAAGRIAWRLGWTGPALTLDTACSSGLVALDLAVRAVAEGRCARALVGAANLMLAPDGSALLARMGALSPTGRCLPFDAAADGFVRGEAGVVLAIEPLDVARARGARVLGVVRGSAVGHDGASSGLTAPRGPAQVAVIRQALAAAGIEPADVGLLEAHGTGTPLGDPVELGAVAEVYGEGRATPLPVHAAKARFGHAEAAAGLVGLLCAIVSLTRRRAPGLVGLQARNPELLETSSLSLSAEATALDDSAPQVAAVSAFGLSGTNAHMLVEVAAGLDLGPAPRAWAATRFGPGAQVPVVRMAWEPVAVSGAAQEAVAYHPGHGIDEVWREALAVAGAWEAAPSGEAAPVHWLDDPGLAGLTSLTAWLREATAGLCVMLSEDAVAAHALLRCAQREREGVRLVLLTQALAAAPLVEQAQVVAEALRADAAEVWCAPEGLRQRVWRAGSVETEPPAVSGRWWITGGTGALGQQIASWLLEAGAAAVVLSGRRRRELAEALRDDPRVSQRPVDVRDVDALRACLDDLSREGALTGVVHAAGALDDAWAHDVTAEALDAQWATKVGAAEVLAEALPAAANLVLVGSAAVMGWPGQAAYAAANAALVPVAAGRRARGGAAVVVAWGPWQGPGMAEEALAAGMRAAGMAPLEAADALAGLAHALASGADLICADWRASPGADRSKTTEAVERVVPQVLTSLLGLRSSPDLDAGLFELGLDSLTAIRFAAEVGARLGREVPATLALDHPSLRAVIAALHGGQPEPSPARSAPGDAGVQVLGLGLRLPGGVDSLDALTEALDAGAPRWSPPPARRADAVGVAAWLEDLHDFEPEVFGVAPADVSRLDPQHRLALEVARHALVDAGLDPESLRGRRVAVLVAVGGHGHAVAQPVWDPAAALGSDHAFAAGRIARWLDTRGPTLTVDTACSSGLTALAQGAAFLARGEAELALVVAARALSPVEGDALAALGALAQDGTCRPLDANTQGYVRGEGAVALLLGVGGERPLASLRAIALGHDGASARITAPHGAAQEAVLREALAQAGLTAADLDLVELHGTGTPLGDPVEVGALVRALEGREDAIEVQSSKAVFGHLEHAAGLVGVAAAVSALRRGRGFPQRQVQTPNPKLPGEGWRLAGDAAARIAGVSAFGLSGSLAHAVLTATAARPQRVGWLFTGQGSQHPGMFGALLANPAAAAVLEAGTAALAQLGLPDLVALARAGDDRLQHTATTQPAILLCQVALAAALREAGHAPACVLGHSVGAFAAAVVAGGLSLEDALRLVAARGQAMGALPEGGAMASLALGPAEVAVLLGEGVEVAAFNAPDDTVISGDAAAVAAVVDAVNARGGRALPLRVSHAFHSAHMEPALDAIASAAAEVRFQPFTLPFISDHAGQQIDAWDAAAVRRAAREPVRFVDALAALATHADALVEVGPHPVLLRLAARHPKTRALPSAATLSRDGRPTLAAALDTLAGWREAPPRPEPPRWARRSFAPSAPIAPRVLAAARYVWRWVALDRAALAGVARRACWEVFGGGPLAAALSELLPDAAAAGPPRRVLVLPVEPDGAPWAAAARVREVLLARETPLVLVVQHTEVHPDHAAAAGLFRTARVELPHRASAVIEVLPGAAPEDVARAIAASAAPDHAPTPAEDELRVTPEAVYAARLVEQPGEARPVEHAAPGVALITGGSGAVGQAFTRALLDAGASTVIWFTRTEPSGEAAALLRDLPQVRWVQGDVSQREDVRRAVSAAAAEGPLTTVVHLAGVLDDRGLARLDAGSLARVFSPKVTGLQHLTAALDGHALRRLVLASSATAWLGRVGQGAYGAANAWVEAEAARLRALGVPAVALAWGPWQGDGMARELLTRFAAEGVRPLRPEDASHLPDPSGPDRLLVVDVEWSLAAASLTRGGPRSLLHGLLPAAGGAPSLAPALGRTPDAPSPPGQTVSAAAIQAVVAELLGQDPSRIDPTRGLFEQGMDSLRAVDLARRIQALTGAPVPIGVVFDHPSVARLARHLAGSHSEAASSSPTARPTSPSDEDPLVLTGVALRVPGADSLDALWRVSIEGRVLTGPAPRARWPEIDALLDPEPGRPGRTYTDAGAFLADIEGFDAGFFGMSPREAAAVDPQQRLLLDLCWDALEQAGLEGDALRVGHTGVYAAVAPSSYDARFLGAEVAGAWSGPGNDPSFAAGRVAWRLGLRGPAVGVQTACSASLVALHLAAQAVRAGECARALVGGVNLMVSPDPTLRLAQLRALSPSGRCLPFSAAADGYVRGEGGVVVLVERRSAALARGAPILAELLSSAVNHNGASSAVWVPDADAQEALLREAWGRAGLTARDLDYLEAHGTGTPLGDPIEARALQRALDVSGGRDAPLPVGALKGNIGHLELAAGLIGLVRAALVLRFGHAPGIPGLDTRNEAVEGRAGLHLDAGPIDLPGARIAGVSAFGLSGTNAHAVIRRLDAAPSAPESPPQPWLLPLGAPQEDALDDLRAAVGEALTDPLLGQLRTAALGRAAGRLRCFAVGEDAAELRRALAQATPRLAEVDRRVLLVFAGRADPEALASLRSVPAVAEAMSSAEEALGEAAHTDPGRTFIAQRGLSAAWLAVFGPPHAAVGYGLGEGAAKVATGTWNLEVAAAWVRAWDGAMAASPPADRLLVRGPLRVVELPGGVRIQAIHGAEEHVLTGEPAALRMLTEQLGDVAIPLREPGALLRLDPGAESAFTGLGGGRPHEPWDLYGALIAALGGEPGAALPPTTLVELGTASGLQGVLRRVWAGPQVEVLSTGLRGAVHRGLLEAVGAAWASGVEGSLHSLLPPGPMAPLPHRPRRPRRCWIDAPASSGPMEPSRAPSDAGCAVHTAEVAPSPSPAPLTHATPRAKPSPADGFDQRLNEPTEAWELCLALLSLGFALTLGWLLGP